MLRVRTGPVAGMKLMTEQQIRGFQ